MTFEERYKQRRIEEGLDPPARETRWRIVPGEAVMEFFARRAAHRKLEDGHLDTSPREPRDES